MARALLTPNESDKDLAAGVIDFIGSGKDITFRAIREKVTTAVCAARQAAEDAKPAEPVANAPEFSSLDDAPCYRHRGHWSARVDQAIRVNCIERDILSDGYMVSGGGFRLLSYNEPAIGDYLLVVGDSVSTRYILPADYFEATYKRVGS